MQDETARERNYAMQDSMMAKSKGNSSLDLRTQNMSNMYSRQSTFLQDTGSKIKVLQSASEKTLKVAWNPKKHQLAFGGDKEKAYLWDMNDNIENAQLTDNLPHLSPDIGSNSMMLEKASVTAINWKPDGTMFITAATDGVCRLWDSKGTLSSIMYNDNSMPLKTKDSAGPGGFTGNGTNDSAQPHSVSPEDIDSIYDCQWNKDGSAIVTVSEKNNVILWNTEGKLRHSYQGHTEPVVNIDWKNNNVFATGSQDGVIKVWDVQSSSAIKTYTGHDNNIKCLKWDNAGALLASGSEDCTVKIWSPNYDKPLYTFSEHKEMIHSLKWSPTGVGTNLKDMEVCLATCSADGTIKIWNVNEGK